MFEKQEDKQKLQEEVDRWKDTANKLQSKLDKIEHIIGRNPKSDKVQIECYYF